LKQLPRFQSVSTHLSVAPPRPRLFVHDVRVEDQQREKNERHTALPDLHFSRRYDLHVYGHTLMWLEMKTVNDFIVSICKLLQALNVKRHKGAVPQHCFQKQQATGTKIKIKDTRNNLTTQSLWSLATHTHIHTHTQLQSHRHASDLQRAQGRPRCTPTQTKQGCK